MDAPFYRTAYDYYRADRDVHRDHLRDVPWEGILIFGATAAGTDFYKMFIHFIVNIRSSLIHLHGFQLLVLLP